MAAALLATYPDVFAGGGIVAGLPYKSAIGMREALGTMFRGRVRTPVEWGDLVRTASGHTGPWPVVSIWQGNADKTVAASNAVELANQWANVHGAPGPASEGLVKGHRHILLRNPDGKPVVELFEIAGMGHGAPIFPDDPEFPLGEAEAFILPVGISSTLGIARFWGLEPGVDQGRGRDRNASGTSRSRRCGNSRLHAARRRPVSSRNCGRGSSGSSAARNSSKKFDGRAWQTSSSSALGSKCRIGGWSTPCP